jgi:hypothetical protein
MEELALGLYLYNLWISGKLVNIFVEKGVDLNHYIMI